MDSDRAHDIIAEFDACFPGVTEPELLDALAPLAAKLQAIEDAKAYQFEVQVQREGKWHRLP